MKKFIEERIQYYINEATAYDYDEFINDKKGFKIGAFDIIDSATNKIMFTDNSIEKFLIRLNSLIKEKGFDNIKNAYYFDGVSVIAPGQNQKKVKIEIDPNFNKANPLSKNDLFLRY
jgi:hypothetical protein